MDARSGAGHDAGGGVAVADLTGRPASLGVSAELWDVLACPCPKHAAVMADEAAGQIVCTDCAARFDVRDGVPVMLLAESTAVEG